jgi:general secretion pathway protein I
MRSAQQGFSISKRSAQQGFRVSMRSAQQGFSISKRSVQQGFTLLEMLVALAIFSLAGLALVRLQAVSARSAFDLRNRTMSQMVVRNLMVERMTDRLAPAFGNTDGTVENGGRSWRWQQGVEPMPDRRLVAITIRVDGGPGQSPAVISFLRSAERPVQ